MDLIDQLRTFIQVAHSGGFTSAATQMDLPRPTVSLAVQQLEARLGTRLLNRTTRRVSLTPDGEALLARASVLVDDADELARQFQAKGAQLTGHLRADVPSRMARRLIAPALPAFFSRHPHVTLELGSSDRPVDLVREGIDCALRVGDLASSSLVARPLGRLRMINCASPAYLARRGTPRSMQQLARHQTIHYATAGGGVAPWEWQEGGHTRTLPTTAQVTTNSAETYIACALAGLGLIQVPAFDVREHLATGTLVEVLAPWPAPPMPIQLVYAHRRQLSRRLQAFGNWLAEILTPALD